MASSSAIDLACPGGVNVSVFKLGPVYWASRITGNHSERWHIFGDYAAATNYRALAYRHAFKDRSVEANPRFITDPDRTYTHVSPIFSAMVVLAYVIGAPLPSDRVTVVIDYRATPRDKYVVSYRDAFSTHKMRRADEAV